MRKLHASALATLVIAWSVCATVAAQAADTAKVVLVAGRPSHGPGDHEFNAGCKLLAKCLAQVPGIEPVVVTGGWPKDESVFDGARTLVFFMDGGGGHPMIKGNHLETLQKLMDKGVGLVCLHYAVEVPNGEPGDKFLDWIGGYYESGYSTNPHWTADIQSLPRHSITRGVKPFAVRDEWYFNIRFRPSLKGVVPIVVAKPDDQDAPGRIRLAARALPAHRRGQGPRRGACLGRRTSRRRPGLRLHRRPRPQELGRPELSQAGAQCHLLDRQARRSSRWGRIVGHQRGAETEPRSQEMKGWYQQPQRGRNRGGFSGLTLHVREAVPTPVSKSSRRLRSALIAAGLTDRARDPIPGLRGEDMVVRVTFD